MLRGFGLEVQVGQAPFEPEGGAYVAASHHAHSHSH
jgi:urease accessory protein